MVEKCFCVRFSNLTFLFEWKRSEVLANFTVGVYIVAYSALMYSCRNYDVHNIILLLLLLLICNQLQCTVVIFVSFSLLALL